MSMHVEFSVRVAEAPAERAKLFGALWKEHHQLVPNRENLGSWKPGLGYLPVRLQQLDTGIDRMCLGNSKGRGRSWGSWENGKRKRKPF